ncbi:hypothetical protein [Streptomyces beijiangensis]|uniref:Uncharacterized protein n=1 Tax=Streptomyces beijiangensis TaxID=163361 RepID=A0A939JEG5_9ACTN|nr:hypothetical protein [Streptomyces beijiangensis]MBO0513061.1 hypothetical protein [Streptomyces beijiangensis]
MLVLLLILLVLLFGLGFLNPIWWVAAAIVVYGLVRTGRSRGRDAGSDYGDYRDYRDRQDRWDRRYRRQRRGRWNRQDRRDSESHR